MDFNTFQQALNLFGDRPLPEYTPDYDPDAKHLVFVYGSIKQGFGNDWTIIQEEYLGTKVTRDRNFDMISMIHFPAVIDGDYPVMGEVYRINGYALQILDMLESNGQFYSRRLIDVNGIDEKVWIYMIPDARGTDREGFRQFGISALATVDKPDEVFALTWRGLNRREQYLLMEAQREEEAQEETDANNDA